jgi:hypothetical protein
MDALASRSPRWRTAPTETVVAHRIRRPSVSGVANRVSSTTFVDAERSLLQRLGDQRQVLERVGRGDPPPSLPLGDAVADGEPVSGIARTAIAPDLSTIGVGDQSKHAPLRATNVCIRSIERSSQWMLRDFEHRCDGNTHH